MFKRVYRTLGSRIKDLHAENDSAVFHMYVFLIVMTMLNSFLSATVFTRIELNLCEAPIKAHLILSLSNLFFFF